MNRDLERIAAQVERAEHFAGLSYLAADGVQHPDVQKAAKAARLAHDAASAAVTGFAALGVVVNSKGAPVVPPSVPLVLLDTPTARRYLAALDAAAAAAADLDRERGAVDADGEPCGVSEDLRARADLFRVQTFGPAGLEGVR